jgi:hypothetical protein
MPRVAAWSTGIAYHDTDSINHGSGELNYKPGHCEEGVPESICHFREKEGVDVSYVKKLADLNHPNIVTPEWQQLYIGCRGWRMDELHGGCKGIRKVQNRGDVFERCPNDSVFAEQKPRRGLQTSDRYTKTIFAGVVWHIWNKAECGEITFPQVGLQLLALPYKKGNNLAYFDFVRER